MRRRGRRARWDWDRSRTSLNAPPLGQSSTRRQTPPRLAPMSLHVFAGVRVRDLHAARPWYDRLFGEPSFFPNDTEAVWTLAEDRSVYVVEHGDGAGNSVVTIFLDDL